MALTHVACAGPHTLPTVELPRLNRPRRLAATGSPSPVSASRAPARVALLLRPSGGLDCSCQAIMDCSQPPELAIDTHASEARPLGFLDRLHHSYWHSRFAVY